MPKQRLRLSLEERTRLQRLRATAVGFEAETAQLSIRAFKAVHSATHPPARLKEKDAADDITEAVLRIRPGGSRPCTALLAASPMRGE